MNFQELFKILKRHISDGENTVCFFKTLISEATDIDNDEFESQKDPASIFSDSTIWSYTKRGLPKKNAQVVLHRFQSKQLARYIKSKNPAARSALAADLQPYAPNADEKNIGKIAADMLEQALREAAGSIPHDEAETIRQQETYNNLKKQYGEFLFQEAGQICPNCGKQMYSSVEGKISKFFEIFILDDKKKNSPDNLIALCPKCYADLQVKKDRKVIKKLKNAKSALISQYSLLTATDDIKLEEGLTNAIIQISMLKSEDLKAALTMIPKEIEEKISPETDLFLYNLVKNNVSQYFTSVDKILKNLDKQKIISYKKLQCQMKSLYVGLSETKSSKINIFEAISRKIHNSTLQGNLYCNIVVSYFVQKCEVFDAAS